MSDRHLGRSKPAPDRLYFAPKIGKQLCKLSAVGLTVFVLRSAISACLIGFRFLKGRSGQMSRGRMRQPAFALTLVSELPVFPPCQRPEC